MTSTVTPAKTMLRRSAATLSAVAMAVVMAGCSSGPTTAREHIDLGDQDHRIDEHHHHIEPSKRNTDSGPERVGVRRANPLRLPARVLAAGSGRPGRRRDQCRPLAEARRLLHQPGTPIRGRVPRRGEDGSAERTDDVQPRPPDGHRRYSHLCDGHGLHLRHGHDDGLRASQAPPLSTVEARWLQRHLESSARRRFVEDRQLQDHRRFRSAEQVAFGCRAQWRSPRQLSQWPLGLPSQARVRGGGIGWLHRLRPNRELRRRCRRPAGLWWWGRRRSDSDQRRRRSEHASLSAPTSCPTRLPFRAAATAARPRPGRHSPEPGT